MVWCQTHDDYRWHDVVYRIRQCHSLHACAEWLGWSPEVGILGDFELKYGNSGDIELFMKTDIKYFGGCG